MSKLWSARKTVAAALFMVLVAAACGTRASDDQFQALLESNGAGVVEDGGVVRSGGDIGSDTDADVAGPGAADAEGGSAGPGAAVESEEGATPDGGGSGSGSGPDADAPAGGGGRANFASDSGVTAETIKVGSVVSVNGPLGPRQFSPTFFGMNAYIEWLNSKGGINGRRIELVTCDDRESEDSARKCAQQLVEEEGIFAFLGNNTRVWDTGAAKYAHDQGVPVIGGYTIGLSGTYFPTIFDFSGGLGYPRDLKVGQDGQTFTSTVPCVAWAARGVERAASIFYSIPISKEAGLNTKSCLEEEGVEVTTYEINPAVPNWDAVAADMQQRGIQAGFDSVDIVANQNLCRALDRRGYNLDFKVSTIAVQARWVKKDFSHPCRESVYISYGTVPLAVDHPEAALFRKTMTSVYRGRFDNELHQWAFDAWLGGIQFKEAVESMGADVTRQGLMGWYNALDDYDCNGLCKPRDYKPVTRKDGQPYTDCVGVVRWNESRGDFTIFADYNDEANCHTGSWVAEPASYSP